MADTTLNRFIARGTTAARLAFTPSIPTPASGPSQGYLWWDTDLQAEYAWDPGTAAWVAMGGGAGTVTHTGALTANAVIVGNGTADIKVLAIPSDATKFLNGAATPAFALVKDSDLSTSDITTNDVGTTKHGFAPKAPGDATKFLNGANPPAWTVPAGSGAVVVQVKNFQTGATATGTTTIPFDDTIPQNTEGDEFLTLAITPTSATNKLRIDVVLFCTNSSAVHQIVALFQDTTASALAAVSTYIDNATGTVTIAFSYFMTAGTTSATTFKVRSGGHAAGTTRINGQSGVGRLFGGVAASSITITESTP